MKNNVEEVVSIIDDLMNKGSNHVNLNYSDDSIDVKIKTSSICENAKCAMQPNEKIEEKGE